MIPLFRIENFKNFREGFRNTQLNYKQIKQTLLRNKTKKYPNDPKTLEGIAEAFLNTSIAEQFGSNEDIFVDTVIEKNFAFTIIASKFTIDFINQNIPVGSRPYVMDGTFDSLPDAYYQLFVISISYNNDVSNLKICLFCPSN